MLVKVIVAICENNGIGKDNKLPWKCKDDMLFFLLEILLVQEKMLL